MNYSTGHNISNHSEPPHLQRITYIDYVKTICIFLMIVGHWTNNAIIYRYIYSFHMPALFVISGFLFRPHPWWKTLISFSVPVFFFSLFSMIVKTLLGEISINTISFNYIIIHIFHYRYGLGHPFFTGVWFLWALFGIRTIFGDLSFLIPLRKFHIHLAVVAIIYMTFENYLIPIDTLFRGYYIGKMIPCLPFFCLGLFLHDKKWEPSSMSTIRIIILSVIVFFLPYVNNAYGIIGNDYGFSYIIFFSGASLITLFLFWGANKLPQSKIIETISKGTLVVLGTHMPLLHILQHLLPESFRLLFPWITIMISYYIILFCQRFFPPLMGKIKL